MPDLTQAQRTSQAHYQQLAARYDHATRYINGVRHRTIAALAVQAGDVVLDVGCGTGYCLATLAQAVGPNGQVIGFEHSAAMLEVAAERVRAAGASNVSLICATAEELQLPPRWQGKVNRVLFSYVHDIMNAPAALANLFPQINPGARIAACSTKQFPAWFFVGNWYLRWSHREYITNFQHFDAPWRALLPYLDEVHVETQTPGSRYICTGSVKRRAEKVISH